MNQENFPQQGFIPFVLPVAVDESVVLLQPCHEKGLGPPSFLNDAIDPILIFIEDDYEGLVPPWAKWP